MNRFQKFCVNALRIIMIIALLIIVISTINKVNFNLVESLSKETTIVLTIGIFSGIGVLFSKLTLNKKIIALLVLGLLIRVWWVLNVNTMPVSDFKKMYAAARALTIGDTTEFRDYGYLSRFPHVVCMTVYMALVILIFPTSNLFVMKIISIILSVLSIYLLYKVSGYFIKNEKVKLGVILFSTLFPPFISYCSTYCTENIAIPLYLLTLLVFFRATEKMELDKWIICGLMLSLSNLFRSVAPIFFIAFIIYILIFTSKNKARSIAGLTMGTLITTIFVSLFLISLNITNKPLWQADEPSFATLLLKGTNIENEGRWSLEDADFVEANLGNPNLSKICIETAINRISKLSFPEAFKFFVNKFMLQWSVGDFGGTYWAFLETNLVLNGYTLNVFQITYICIMTLAFVSVFNKRAHKNTAILYILLCGFGLFFMIIETQGRYGYIVSWIFVLLAGQGIENLIEWKELSYRLVYRLRSNKD